MRWLVLFGLVCLAAAAPQKSDKDAQILKQEFDQQNDGSYKYSFETDNGIQRDETGTLKKGSGPDSGDAIVAEGKFSYTAPDGQVITITYVADDVGGFQPVGAHLPTPPPIPPAIQKALDLIASLPPQKN